jgi:aminomuconate-semialdehyde/2-hydroxymuconate-6-semialdehyde dehydrogenase
VVGLISPWNLPLYLLTWKVAPAISFGNTAVAKPSEITPMTAFLFSQLCGEAGLPAGVLNIVHGSGVSAGDAIVRHLRVNTISFTGGTVTGREIARTASPQFKKLALELGGKNPNIIFADADMEEVVRHTLRSSFANQGQVCLCGSRIFVEDSAYESFVERFVDAAAKLKVGDPLEHGTDLGAVVSAMQRDKILSYLQLAREEGGTVLCGGGQPASLPERCRNGYFIEPTVIAGLGIDCRVNQEEIFGPVVTIMPFKTESDVVEFANATPYGLAASLWTSNVGRAHRVAAQIQSGTVWVNCWMIRDLRVPFGGMKNSGVGREGGDEAMRFFTEPKNICVRVPGM